MSQPLRKTSYRLDPITESQTLSTAAKVRELRAKGIDVVSLTLGEPDFDTPDHIKAAAIEAVNKNLTHYPPIAGTPELRAAAAQFFKTYYQLPYEPANIVVSTGAKQSLMNAFMALLGPSDEVLIPAPYWVSYIPMCELAGATIKTIPSLPQNRLRITPEQLEAAITPQTRMFVFNNPCNPSGVVYTPAETNALAEVLARHPQIIVVSDEIYSFIRYNVDYQSIGAHPALFDRTVTANGVAKAFAMTGWRIGFIGAPVWIAKLCEKFQGQVTSGACSIAQYATVAALSQGLEPTCKMVRIFQERRDFCHQLITERCPELKTDLPEGAFYLYPDVSAYLGAQTPEGKTITDADDMAAYLLDVEALATVSGKAFGSENHLRLSYACSTDVFSAAIDKLEQGLAKLRR